MSTIIKLNEPLEAGYVRGGTKTNGEKWEMIVVKDQSKAGRDIVIFVDNAPCGVQEGGMFKIGSITSVKWGAQKDREGKWRDKVSCNAVIASVASATKHTDRFIPQGDTTDIYNGVMQEITTDDDELPW